MKLKKIYIISGKARSGKNTVAKIIKNIYNEKNQKTINISYGYYVKEYAKAVSNWDGSEKTKPRSLLQELGTSIRTNIDNLFFIKRIIDDIKVYSNFFDIITISDARLIKELELPKKYFDSVTTIRVNKDNFDNGLTETEQEHETEIQLDNYDKFDYNLINNGNIEDLEKNIRKIIGD